MNSKHFISLFFASTFLFLASAFAQPVYFETSFGTGSQDYARSVRQLADSSIYVAGYSNGGTFGGYDYSLNKLDCYGNLLWTKYFGDSLDNNGFYMNTCADGNFIFVGETQTPSNLLDILLYKTDTSGNILWAKQYGTSVNESAKYVTQTSDGGYILCGFQNDAFASNDTYVIKTDSDGNLQWQKTLGGTDNEYSDMVRETPEGDFIVTADTKSFGAGGYDIEVTKLNSAGTVVWDSVYGDSLNNGCQGILITSKNKYLSYGETEVFLFSPFDFYLELLDTNGNSLWQKTFGGTNTDAIFSVNETPDGGFICTGYSNSYSPGPLNLVILKTDSLGNLQWTQNYGGAGIDIGYEIVPSVFNGYLITGKTFVSDDDCYLLHLDTAGLLTTMHEQHANESISVFPNPSDGKFTIGNLRSAINSLKVYDVFGKLVYQEIIRQKLKNVNINDAKSGIYFYRIEENNGSVSSGKLIIER